MSELPFCACGCGRRVSKPGNKFIHGHNCGNQDKLHPGINSKPEIDKFVKDNQGKHFCKCGCGGVIEIMKNHFTQGIPEFIHGHNRKKPDIMKVCEWCGDDFIVEGNCSQVNKKFCSDECRYEYQGEVMRCKPGGGFGHGNRVKRITLICKQCGYDFDVRDSESDRVFCCHGCYTDWCSENLVGDKAGKFGVHPSEETRERISATLKGEDYDSGEWSGFKPNHRDYVLTEAQCVKLNERFLGSDMHHITSSIVIYIPTELHNHYKPHNLKNGKNMDIVNTVALQYLNGYYNDNYLKLEILNKQRYIVKSILNDFY